MSREQIDTLRLDGAMTMLEDQLLFRLGEKGYGTFASSHEILGIVAEEYTELIEAVRSNKKENVKNELLDIAVACVFAVACMEQNSLDW